MEQQYPSDQERAAAVQAEQQRAQAIQEDQARQAEITRLQAAGQRQPKGNTSIRKLIKSAATRDHY